MKNRSRIWFALVIVLIALCASTAWAEQDDTEAFALADLHYSVPGGWSHTGYEEDGNDYLYHYSDASGAIGDGAVLVGVLYDDYTEFSPGEFYSGCYAELIGESGYTGRTDSITISGYEAAVLYVDGPVYGVGESASASLVIMQDDCVYWLSFYAGSGTTEDWREYITEIYIGGTVEGAYGYASDGASQFMSVKRGDKGEDVRQLQLRLIALGYLSGSADGDFGPRTESAVIAYQEAAGLPTTGECDYETYVSLNDGDAPTAPKPAATPKPTEKPSTGSSGGTAYIGNKNTKKFHETWCSSVDQMKDKNKVSLASRDAAISKGYVPCKRCNP